MCNAINCTVLISSELNYKEIENINLHNVAVKIIKCTDGIVDFRSLSETIQNIQTDYIQIVTQKIIYNSPDIYYCPNEHPLIMNRLLYWNNNTYNVFPYSVVECSGDTLCAKDMISCAPYDDSICVWENKIFSRKIIRNYIKDNLQQEKVVIYDLLNYLAGQGLTFFLDKRKIICIDKLVSTQCYGNNVSKIDSEIRRIVASAYEYNDFRLDILKTEIEKNDVISFDIFDTLLVRPTWNPEDVFLTVQDYANSIIQPIDYIEFVELRKNAEQIARDRKHKKTNSYEITYSEIYKVLGEIFPFSQKHLAMICEFEIKTEKKFLKPRLSALSLLKYALVKSKEVIFTSDMYYGQYELRNFLSNLEIDLSDIKIFVSSEYNTSKYSGGLFEEIKKQYPHKSILHIGDNYQVDYCNAVKAGLNAFHFPSTISCMRGDDPSYGSSFWKRVYGIAHDPISSENFNRFSGLRSLNAVAANKLFDNPFEFRLADSEVNGNAFNIGYYFLGSYIISFAQRVAEKYDTGQYAAVNLIARDCYLLKRALEILRPDIPINYVRLSRIALTPLCISESENGILLRNSGVFTSVCPLDFVELYENVLLFDKTGVVEAIVRKGFGIKKKFVYFEEYSSFCKFFANELIDYNSVKNESFLAKTYFDKFFEGHTLFVDLGYSYRAELILTQLYGYDIDSLYVHINSDIAYLRSSMAGGYIDCIEPFYPHEAVWVREKMSSELSPSCIGYEAIDGTVVPKLDSSFSTNAMQQFYLDTIQNASLEFVSDFKRYFNQQNGHFYYPSFLGMLAFEKFFYDAKDLDRMIFGAFHFEDKNGMGADLNLKDIWDDYHKCCVSNLNNLGESVHGPYIELNSLSKTQRAFLFLLFYPKTFIRKLKKNMFRLLDDRKR